MVQDVPVSQTCVFVSASHFFYFHKFLSLRTPENILLSVQMEMIHIIIFKENDPEIQSKMTWWARIHFFIRFLHWMMLSPH